MSLFVLLKLVHVLAAITAVGANLTYPFWLRRAAGNRERVLDTIDAIVKLDARVANVAYGIAFVTGAAMIATGAYSFQTLWVAAAIVLFVLVTILGIAVYAPVIRRLRAAAERDITSPEYAALDRRQTQLGLLATAIAIAIVTVDGDQANPCLKDGNAGPPNRRGADTRRSETASRRRPWLTQARALEVLPCPPTRTRRSSAGSSTRSSSAAARRRSTSSSPTTSSRTPGRRPGIPRTI